MERTIELMESKEKVINDALRIALRERDASVALDKFLSYLGERMGGGRIYVCEGEKGCPVNNTLNGVLRELHGKKKICKMFRMKQ